MSEVHALLPSDSVKIITGRKDGPISVQIPARLILGADDVLRFIRETGLTLTLFLDRNDSARPDSAMVWRVSAGGDSSVGPTPWSALEQFSKNLKER